MASSARHRGAKHQLIIGLNVPEAFWVLEERCGNKENPYAIRSRLGWTLIGPMEGASSCVNFMMIVNAEKEDVLVQQLERSWKTDNAGLVPNYKVSMSIEDKRVLAVMESSSKLVDGHYQLAFPWKECVPYLSSNQILAEQRLKLLK